MLRVGIHGDILEDNRTDVTIQDSENVGLWVRVGPVFTAKGEHSKLGVWLEFQEEFMNSKIQGPILISKSNWNRLDKHVRRSFKSHWLYRNITFYLWYRWRI